MINQQLQIHEHETINLMVTKAHRTVSFPVNGTNPYERVGKHMRQEIYNRCQYSISYGRYGRLDHVVVRH